MRNFPAEIEAVGDEWEQRPFDTLPRFTQNKSLEGSTNPKLGKCLKCDFDVVLKPHNTRVPTEFSAHEKIVADLARDLGLPIAPVQLWQFQTPIQGPSLKSVSLVCAPTYYECVMGQAAIKAAMKCGYDLDGMRQLYGAMAAFERWTNAIDRWDRHLVFTPNYLYFIDYGWSLGNNIEYSGSYFDREGNEIVTHPRFQESYQEICNNISGLSNERIAAIVNRIPDEFLPNQQKRYIITRLVDGKD